MPYPGQKSIGLPPTVHKQIMDAAKANGMSAAELLSQAVSTWLDARSLGITFVRVNGDDKDGTQ